MTLEQQNTNYISNKPNYTYSIISVSLVLLLLGFFALFLLHAKQLMKSYQEKLNIIIELDNTAKNVEILQLKSLLKKAVFTKAETVKHITKEEGAKILEKDFGEDFIKLNMSNPLFDVITFNTESTYMNADSLAAISQVLKKNPIVRDVYYQENLVDNISKNIEKLGFVAISISLFFIFVAIYLIHNTIKLALFANRFLIKNMQLVGATWEFISRPYLIKSIWNGLISASIASSLLYFMLYIARIDFPELKELQSTTGLFFIFLALFIIGISITTLSTYFVINKYLKMRVDDMY